MKTQGIDIDKLEAGPETDTLVAEKVMGYHIHRFIWHGMEGDEEHPCETWIPSGSQKSINPVPFSTDIAAAFQMAEEIDLFNPFYSRLLYKTTEGETELWAVGHLHWEWIEPDVTAPTAPLAICKAALKAVSE